MLEHSRIVQLSPLLVQHSHHLKGKPHILYAVTLHLPSLKSLATTNLLLASMHLLIPVISHKGNHQYVIFVSDDFNQGLYLPCIP